MRTSLMSFLGPDLAFGEAFGALLAFLLIVALRLTLPRHARGLLRLSIVLLALYAVVRALSQLAAEGGTAQRVLLPLSLLLLLAGLGRSAVLLALDVVLGRRLVRPLPKIIRDIVQALVYAGAALVTLRAAGVEPGSLLTTSALLTAVVGLSLQETLGNLFAGLAIQMQRPFEVADWIQFDDDPKHIGRVVEINWRATKVITLDHFEVIVPNASLAKAPIRNYTKPTRASRRSVFVSITYDVPPGRVHETILKAIGGSPGVLAQPPPSVVTNAFGDSGVEYWVRFFTDAFDRRDAVDGAVRDRIWYALRRSGIAIPYPHRTLHMHEISDETRALDDQRKLEQRDQALRCVDFLEVLPPEEHRALAAMTEQRIYAAGETIVLRGDRDGELFIIERGEVAVIFDRPGDDRDVEIARLGPGKFFGEMSLVTGDERSATIKAVTDCDLLVVGHAAFQRILERSPDLAEKISHVLSNRQLELSQYADEAPESEAPKEGAKHLLGRIRSLFAL